MRRLYIINSKTNNTNIRNTELHINDFDLFDELIQTIDAFFAKTPNCSVALDGTCDQPSVHGHIIPNAKLRLIQNQSGRVTTASFNLVKHLRITRHSLSIGRTPPKMRFEMQHTRSASMTRKFACREHDQSVFSPIEQSEIDWNDPYSMFVMAYRSVIAQVYNDKLHFELKPKMDFILGSEHMHETIAYCRGRLELKNEMERLHSDGAYDRWEVEVIDIDSPPTVGASIVMNRAITKDEFRSLGAELVIPASEASFKPIPIVINVYPHETKQSAMVAYPKWAKETAKLMVPALGEKNEELRAALLSRTLLEESEIIAIKEEFWQSIGKSRRDHIQSYFSDINLLNDAAYDRPDFDPRPLNLFDVK